MKQKAIIAFALLAACYLLYSESQTHQDDYLSWKTKYGYTWTEQEDSYRRVIYQQNVEKVLKHNQDPTQTYKMGINQFTGLTTDEFKMTYLNPRTNPNIGVDADVGLVPINADVDWVKKGMVSPVRDQKNCGSCWAFSAVGVMESWLLMKGQNTILSPQQLVDCSKKYGNAGCNGGFNYQGLAYVKDHGIATEAAYPYLGHNHGCMKDGGDIKITKVNTAKGCTAIVNAIMDRPIGVSADATNWSPYSSGVFKNCKRDLNHDILLVGFSSEYYTIKNSWGKDWGEKGFIRLAPGNTCGVCDDKSPWVQ